MSGDVVGRNGINQRMMQTIQEMPYNDRDDADFMNL